MTSPENLQRQILGGIFFSPGEAVSARTLRDTLETVHGQMMSLSALRAELIRLADAGAIEFKADLCRLTEFGIDAFRGRVTLPGWAA